jgi:hypothetical protein
MIRFQFDLPVAARGTLARVLWLQGFPDQAMRMAKDNVEDARSIDRVASVSLYWALDAACVIALAVGDLMAAEQSLAVLLDHAVKHALGFWQAMCHSYEGQLLIKRGDAASGCGVSVRASTNSERLGKSAFARFLGALAEGMAAAGPSGTGPGGDRRALADCERTGALEHDRVAAHQGASCFCWRAHRMPRQLPGSVPARARLGASASRAVFGAALCQQPCPAVARSGPE